MTRVMTGIVSLAALLFFSGVIVGGFYLRSAHAPVATGQAGVSPSPLDAPSARPTDTPRPLGPVDRRIAAPQPPPPAVRQPGQFGTPCPRLVITSFTAQPAPRSVVLWWTVSGGCGDETGSIGGQFTGMPVYPGPGWVVHIRSSWRTYTDHPQKPPSSQQCSFSLSYSMILNGVAPDGGAPHPAFAQVSNVYLC